LVNVSARWSRSTRFPLVSLVNNVMDPEQQTSALLAPTRELLSSVKVFPLIPALKRDILVSLI
jgi:hypothetical protein